MIDSAELAAFCTEKKVEQIRLLASLHYAYARVMREPVHLVDQAVRMLCRHGLGRCGRRCIHQLFSRGSASVIGHASRFVKYQA